MRISKIKKKDNQYGPGVRVGVYTQGCFHRCEGCFSKETWDFNGGIEWSSALNNKIIDLCKDKQIGGLSILGGDPFCMYATNLCDLSKGDFLLELLQKFRNEFQDKKDIWLWTGYILDDLVSWSNSHSKYHPLVDKAEAVLPYIDVVVDGPFLIKDKYYDLPYSGSKNQRVIDIKESLKNKKIILYQD